MLRCAILDDYQQVALGSGHFDPLRGAVDFASFPEHMSATEALVTALAPFDIIIAMRERTPFDQARLARLPNLKLLITTGMRNASIDLPAAAARGILVCGTEGFAGSTAELAWGLLLGLTRRIPAEFANFRQGGPWQISVGRDLNGLTLGVVGLGTLGKKLAGFGKAFGMRVIGWSRSNSPERSAGLGIDFSPDLASLLKAADVVSLHIPLNNETRGLIGAAELALMKPGAILLNTSRGPIVEETALIAALKAGRLGGAGLDVFDAEPLPLDHPFRRLENVLCTPHLGYVTEKSYRAFFAGAAEAIAAWRAGAPVRVLAGPG